MVSKSRKSTHAPIRCSLCGESVELPVELATSAAVIIALTAALQRAGELHPSLKRDRQIVSVLIAADAAASGKSPEEAIQALESAAPAGGSTSP